MADAAEIEDHDRLQRMLPGRAKRAVVDHLHQAQKTPPWPRHKHDRRALPGKLDRARRHRRQEAAPRSAHSDAAERRSATQRQARAPCAAARRQHVAVGGGESDRGRQQPGGREQNVTPDDPGEDKGRRRQRQQQQQPPPARPNGAPAANASSAESRANRTPRSAGTCCAEPGAIGSISAHSTVITGDCQSPQRTLGDVLVDEFGVIGHDAGIEDQQRQADSRRRSSRRSTARHAATASHL